MPTSRETILTALHALLQALAAVLSQSFRVAEEQSSSDTIMQ